MKNMLKKLSIYLSICAGFIFCFFNSNKINVLAISTDNNQNIGSIPFKLDIENYNTYQLVNSGEMSKNNIFAFNSVKSFTFTDFGISMITSDDYVIGSVGTYFNPTRFENVETGKTYTLSFDITYNNYFAYFKVGNERNLTFSYCYSNSRCNYTFVAEDIYNYIIYGYDSNSSNVNNAFTISNFMIYEGEYDENKIFVTPFQFGYNVSGRIEMMCAQATAPGINFKGFINNNTLFDVTFNNGDSCYSFDINNVYVPFNIDNNGYVSFYSNIKFTLSSNAATLYSIDHGSYLRFTPIYYGFYKGNLINNILYSNLNYTSNNIYFNDFQYIYTGDSTGNSLVFNGNKNVWGYSQWIDNNIKTNVSSDFIENIKITNQFKFHEFLGFSFDVNLFSNYINQPLDMFINNNILVSFGSINSRVINSSSTITPLPDNDLTTDKYNSCSTWYDIPCQLGNAITYVIYEAPIISPIVTFVLSFTDSIEYLIKYIKWFETFGIIFSLFIFILFIRLLIMIIKGSNDDRGNKNE